TDSPGRSIRCSPTKTRASARRSRSSLSRGGARPQEKKGNCPGGARSPGHRARRKDVRGPEYRHPAPAAILVAVGHPTARALALLAAVVALTFADVAFAGRTFRTTDIMPGTV